ncbi:H [Escherichia phage phiK]|uniref:Minor spike protein n=1 Tax=Enterobacteria phage phiK TaxID=10848 RepID=VGH_BPPHK|nr:H [Escherichia phage phiK] [Escherichia phage phiK]P03649.2 RecName: Full=Minor spike protein; AltName: Full=H protein; AltName: Full=Pilot protein [Alphatrevirus phiK]CAA42893.1 H [Escherichia phage phiK] [Escherichia phage phiK]
MLGSIIGGIGSSLLGGIASGGISSLLNKMFSKMPEHAASSAGLTNGQGTIGMDTDAGIQSAIQGSNVPPAGQLPASNTSGVMADAGNMIRNAGRALLDGTIQAGSDKVKEALIDKLVGGNDAKDRGKATRDYLAAAFPELNPWERAGAGASTAGLESSAQNQQKEMLKMQLDNQKDIAKMQMNNNLQIAGIQSATSRQNTKDSVYAQNEMLQYNQRESQARVASILANTDLTTKQATHEIMRMALTRAQETGQHLTNSQIMALEKKVYAEIGKIHQDTQNSRYGSSQVTAAAKDVTNMITDASSGLADWASQQWDSFFKDGKSDGIPLNTRK